MNRRRGRTRKNALILQKEMVLGIDSSIYGSYKLIFIESILLIGLYHEPASAVVSILMMLVLVRSRVWKVDGSPALLFSIVFPICCLFSCIWAVDRGMAIWGAVKYLPVALSAICLLQMTDRERYSILQLVPYLGVFGVIGTLFVSVIPALREHVFINGRMGGLFQYPNTFAVFLLIGFIVLLCDGFEQGWHIRILCGIVLCFGILNAASRAVTVIALPAIIATVFCRKRRKVVPFAALSIFGGGVLAFFGVTALHMGRIERLATTSLSASTWLGRLLYWRDAIPVVLSNPLGLGYLGYYFTQGSFQTGVYSVRSVHNGFLQILLDVGWLPFVLLLIAILQSLFSKRVSPMQRIILIVLAAHGFADFDFEFVGIILLMQLCMDWRPRRKKRELDRYGRRCVYLVGAILCAGCLYIGSTSLLTYCGFHGAASVLYPWNTLSNMELLARTEDVEIQEEQAERILKQNPYLALAWNVKARSAYAHGDFESYILCKKTALSLARYDIEEYIDYYRHLRTGVDLYHREGDWKSEKVCIQEIMGIQHMIDDVLNNTSPLAYQIVDRPDLEMPKGYKLYIEFLNRDSHDHFE